MKIRSGLHLMVALVLCSMASGCVAYKRTVDTGHFSPLELRAIQTRTYDESDLSATLKTVLNVLQDEGYMVEFGNTELGLLSASKETSGGVGFTSMFPGPRLIILATVNVTAIGDQTKVRISLKQRLETAQGDHLATPIVNPVEYQELFAKLDRSMFIYKQGL